MWCGDSGTDGGGLVLDIVTFLLLLFFSICLCIGVLKIGFY